MLLTDTFMPRNPSTPALLRTVGQAFHIYSGLYSGPFFSTPALPEYTPASRKNTPALLQRVRVNIYK
jgi:hypothetical protein